MVHPAGWDEELLLRQCDIRRQRRSGPGGQHRNKVETAVVITHRESGISGEASERRSQEQNRQMALFRLRVNLALHVRQQPLDDRPSSLWRARCRGGRIAINPSHDDFPAVLAEALDFIVPAHGDLQVASKSLGCTASQLTRLLKLENRALERINQLRRNHELRPLK